VTLLVVLGKQKGGCYGQGFYLYKPWERWVHIGLVQSTRSDKRPSCVFNILYSFFFLLWLLSYFSHTILPYNPIVLRSVTNLN
jgi:hypothetical protein